MTFQVVDGWGKVVNNIFYMVFALKQIVFQNILSQVQSKFWLNTIYKRENRRLIELFIFKAIYRKSMLMQTIIASISGILTF